MHIVGKKKTLSQGLSNAKPSPFSHIRTQAVEGKGLPSSKNLGFHSGAAWEEDATPGPTWVCGS